MARSGRPSGAQRRGRICRRAHSTAAIRKATPRPHTGAYFADGLTVHLLSPVLISYYLSVVPSFVPANASRLYYSGLAATHVSVALLCHAMWATALDFMRRWFVRPWRRKVLQAASGLALIGLAMRILL